MQAYEEINQSVLKGWEQIRGSLGVEDFPAGSRFKVENVVVVLAGSRTGSSYLFSLLARSGYFIAPAGEETPFYRLAGLGHVREAGDSDALSDRPGETEVEAVAQGILGDLGTQPPRFPESESGLRDFTAEALKRFLLQWPQLQLDPDGLLASFRERLKSSHERPEADPQGFWSGWLRRLQENGYAVTTSAYDGLPAAGAFSPDRPFFEDPPYLVPGLRKKATLSDLREKAVLLKSSSNCYRIPFLKRLFPRARFHWVVLTRNPAGSVNGLMDGWLSGTFQTHYLRGIRELEIPGYSDSVRGGQDWWKFDLAPGWEERVREPLENVCAFQWKSANRSIRQALDEIEEPFFHVRYEDLLRPEKVGAAIRGILSFVDPSVAANAESVAIPSEAITRVVMGVQKPSAGKWKKRADQILSALEDGELRDIAQGFGYDLKRVEEFP